MIVGKVRGEALFLTVPRIRTEVYLSCKANFWTIRNEPERCRVSRAILCSKAPVLVFDSNFPLFIPHPFPVRCRALAALASRHWIFKEWIRFSFHISITALQWGFCFPFQLSVSASSAYSDGGQSRLPRYWSVWGGPVRALGGSIVYLVHYLVDK